MRLLPVAAIPKGAKVNLRPGEAEPLACTVTAITHSAPFPGRIMWSIAERADPIHLSAAMKVEVLELP